MILVTNDDGIQAKGIQALVSMAERHGEVVVFAPMGGQSGMAHAITTREPIFLEDRGNQGGTRYYACSGTPVDCVKLALNQVLDRKPDFVLSGINHGSNTSSSIIYSGTMGAAIEACLHGIDAIGFSLDTHRADADFDASVRFAEQVLLKVMETELPPYVCLNVNIPEIPAEEVKGLRVCRQTKGLWVEEFVRRQNPDGKSYYWLTGKFHNLEPEEQDTDQWAVDNGYVSVVPISVDLTAHGMIGELKNLGYESR